jgi:hypothetical protein
MHQILELENVPFELVKVCKSLNVFEPLEFEHGLNRFDLVLPGTVVGAHRSAPASPLFCAARMCAIHEHRGRAVRKVIKIYRIFVFRVLPDFL